MSEPPESTLDEPSDASSSPAPERTGDPLEGLWHWSDHPAVRIGFVIAILLASLIAFPVLAMWMF